MIGIRNIFRLAADQAVTASTVLVDVAGLAVNLAPGQRLKFRFYVPCAVAGTAPGLALEVITTVAPAQWNCAYKIINGSTSAFGKVSVQTAQAAVSNALANIANHLAEIEGEVTGGVTASVLKLQFAQLVSDAALVTILRGATLEVVYES
jgi:hypothetical protein